MTITYIVAAVVLLGLCIFVHELGHLLGGRMVGIKAKVFSLGYGKGVIKKQIGDTTYQVTLIPLGGYCQFYGEDPSEERTGKEYEFLSAHPLKRIVTVAMGPLFNLFFGILLFMIMNMVGYAKETNKIHIPEQFRAGTYQSAAYDAGIRSGDTILEINGHEIQGFSDIQTRVFFSDGKELTVKARRDDRVMTFAVSPKKYEEKGRYTIGVVPYGEQILIAGLIKGDVAEKAGLEERDEVTAIDGRRVRTPAEFTDYIKKRAGEQVSLTVKRNGEELTVDLTPRVNEFIVLAEAGSSANRAGGISLETEQLRETIDEKGVMLNGMVYRSYDAFMEVIRKADNEITIAMGEGEYTGIPSVEKRGFIGVYPVINPQEKIIRYGFGSAISRSFTESYQFVALNIRGIGMLFSGSIKVRENLSGPIRIAKFAGDVAYYKGVSAFIILMAKISIILMVMNLLPIPVVDGGHLVFFTIELVRGRPLSQKIMERIQTVGVVLLITLGIFIIINDISMLPVIQKLFN